MFSIKSLISGFVDLVASGATDKDIDNLLESVKVLNYDLSLVRYKDSEDEDMRLAYEYLKKRPFCMALYPYEKKRNMSPVKVCYDEGLKMNYVMHNGHPLYFPKGENEKFVSWLYRYAIEEDDVVGNGYRQRDLLEKCGQQRVFVTMDMEGDELEVLKSAQEYLKAAKNPIILAVCAYHRTTDYDDLMRFFEEIGYHTETQPGYIYTDVNDGYGVHSLRRGVIRAVNF